MHFTILRVAQYNTMLYNTHSWKKEVIQKSKKDLKDIILILAQVSAGVLYLKKADLIL